MYYFQPAPQVGVSAKSKSLKKKKEQYDPFREYANDSTDEDSPDKQETSDEAEISDDDESEKTASVTERVFLKSVVYKETQSEDGQTPSKRARIETSDNPLDYTEQLYEFGKYVAEQLLCLDVEDARVAQAEITAVLSKFNMNKITRCMAEPSTSNIQPTTSKLCASGSRVTRKVSQGKPLVSSVTHSRSKKNTAESSVNQSVVSHANTAGPAVTQTGIQVKTEGLMHGPPLTEFAVLNVNPDTSSMTPCGYVIVPTTTESGFTLTTQLGNTVGQLMTQSGSGTFVGSTVNQPGSSQVITTGISMTQPESSNSLFSGTLVKIEPVESDSSHSHVTVITPNVTGEESLVIKYEPDSEDET